MKRMLALLLAALLLTGCAGRAAISATELSAEYKPAADVASTPISDDARAAAANFAVLLLAESADKENALVSPLSVLLALGMAEIGAGGQTLSQMEQATGLSRDALADEFAGWAAALPDAEKAKTHIANSVWLRDTDSLTVSPDFLQENADRFGAQVYRAAFDDSTLRDVNRWVKQHTDGQIEKMLSEIPKNTQLILLNALSFDAEWADIYEETQVRDGTFTTAGGAEREVKFLRSGEYRYLTSAGATGVMKNYAGGTYAFAALLPDEGKTPADVLAALSGAAWLSMLENVSNEEVITAIPKFKVDFSATLNAALMDLGMTDAFDPGLADFSAMGTSLDGPLFIGAVLHKTAIAVDERGTKAGAATAVMMDAGAPAPSEPPKQVILDRPFVYAVVDTATGIPLFFGVLDDPG